MDKSPNNPRVLTVIEGREENQQIITDLEQAAKSRNWKIFQIKEINSDKIARFDFKDIPLDFVLFRDLTYNNYIETERVLDYLKKNKKIGINLNPTGGRVATSDKHYQQGLFMLDPFLKEYALPTFEAKHKANVMSYIDGKRVSFPIVLKYRLGTTGKDITLIKNEDDLDGIKSFNNLLIEQYIEANHDWRVFVIGGKAVGIMKKSGDKDHPEDFKAWSAGKIKSREEDPEVIEILSKIACRAAEVSGLDYTGVDIIQDKHTKHFYILETNFAAGWMNRFIATTNISIPDLILDWFEEQDVARNHSTLAQTKKV